MKRPFNLDEYIHDSEYGDVPVITREGIPVNIIYTYKKGDFPIVALIGDEEEVIITYSADGKAKLISGDSKYDLFFAPVKREGWVNIYNDPTHPVHAGHVYCGQVYTSEVEAFNNRQGQYITTTKIEWEE